MKTTIRSDTTALIMKSSSWDLGGIDNFSKRGYHLFLKKRWEICMLIITLSKGTFCYQRRILYLKDSLHLLESRYSQRGFLCKDQGEDSTSIMVTKHALIVVLDPCLEKPSTSFDLFSRKAGMRQEINCFTKKNPNLFHIKKNHKLRLRLAVWYFSAYTCNFWNFYRFIYQHESTKLARTTSFESYTLFRTDQSGFLHLKRW